MDMNVAMLSYQLKLLSTGFVRACVRLRHVCVTATCCDLDRFSICTLFESHMQSFLDILILVLFLFMLGFFKLNITECDVK